MAEWLRDRFNCLRGNHVSRERYGEGGVYWCACGDYGRFPPICRFCAELGTDEHPECRSKYGHGHPYWNTHYGTWERVDVDGTIVVMRSEQEGFL